MSSSSNGELLRGTLDMLILKAVSQGPEHGYGIVRRLRRLSDDVLNVEEGSLYPALHRLERRGHLEHEWRASESNRRAKYYRLTRRGRAQLRAETDRWALMSTAIGKVMATQRASTRLSGATA
jgi:transcriptional regulator